MKREDQEKLLRLYARTNGEHRKLELKLAWLEREFAEIIGTLTEEQQDIVWDFVLSSDALDRLLLESIWEFIDFEGIVRRNAPNTGRPFEE